MKKMRQPALNIEIASASWKRIKGLERRLQKAAELTLAVLPEALLPAAQKAQMTLLLTTDVAVKTLNHDYRGLNKPTNVLSFPHCERRELVRLGKGKSAIYAGDIAVAYQYVVKEAKAERKMLQDHLTHLMVHGILHLFGYDHDTDSRAASMEKKEKEILAALGLPDPYADIDVNEPRRSAKHKK